MLVIEGQFNNMSSSGSRSSSNDSPPSSILYPTPESVVVSCQSDSVGIAHVLSSNVVTFPSHSDSVDRSSQFCNVLCTQKTGLSTILTVRFSFIKSVIVTCMLPFGFVDSDRRFPKKRRKVGN